MFRILAIGDVVGRPGRDVVEYFVPKLREEREIDFVVVNAENVAAGSGINERGYRELRKIGADVLTMGDHAYKRKESMPLYDKEERLLRPANWPTGAPGRGACIVEGPRGVRVGVIHLQGRVFMNPAGDFFEEVDRQLDAMKQPDGRGDRRHARGGHQREDRAVLVPRRPRLVPLRHAHARADGGRHRPAEGPRLQSPTSA